LLSHSLPDPNESHEDYAVDERAFTTSLEHRLLDAFAVLGPIALSRPSSSSSGSVSTLRLSPELERILERSASRRSQTGETSPSPVLQDERQPKSRQKPAVRFADNLPGTAKGIDFALYPVHSSLRVSNRTASAILSTLEALRNPNPFTPDLAEENADMAEMGGNGRASNGGARAAGGPVPVPQQGQPPRGITTPRDIMRQRAEREEKRRAEAAAQGQTPEGSSVQPLRSDRPPVPTIPTVPATHGRTTSAPLPPLHQGPGDSGYASFPEPGEPRTRPSGSYNPQPPTSVQSARAPPQRADPSRTDPATAYSTDMPTSYRSPRGSTQASTQPQPRPAPQPAPATSAAARNTPQAQPRQPGSSQLPPAAAGPSGTQPTTASQRVATGSQGTISSFPHAFERWETLSSHWEGLTSYWIHRLEQNTEELQREPMLQQLSRQVTDLSAAGANLFHAVVELQRLRASSERKFQRWFYETRRESERQQEITGQMEKHLQTERQARSDDIRRLQDLLNQNSSSNVNSQRLATEMRRELQISREEARRAWEELGRREQEERDRTTALREGQPIVIGGIQVLPTAQQTTGSRRESVGASQQPTAPRPVTRDGSSAPPPLSGVPAAAYPQPIGVPQASPTDTDPFTETSAYRHQPPATTNGVAQPNVDPTAPSSSRTAPGQGGQFYNQPHAYLHATSQSQPSVPTTAGTDYEAQSYVPSEEAFSSEHEDDEFEYDEFGNVVRRGLRSDEEDEYDVQAELAREAALRAKYGVASSTAVAYPAIPAPTSGRFAPTAAGPSVAGPSSLPVPHTSATAQPGTVASAGGNRPVPAPTAPHSGYEDADPADYEGTGFDDEWESRINYHPTRLSDVPEQDEESRASERSGHTPRIAF
jgi:hypothetical protein